MARGNDNSKGRDAEDSRSIRAFYRWQAGIYDLTRWAFLFGRREAIRELSLRPGAEVLEVGCGTGLNFGRITSAIQPQGRITGIDFSTEMLGRALRRVNRNVWSHVELRMEDAADLDLSARFDAILFSYSISMIPRWRQALTRAAAHLRPAGTMCVLDFGTFEAWPWPMRPIITRWLRVCRVETAREIEDVMRELLPDVCSRRRLGGYYFLCRARVPGKASKTGNAPGSRA